MILNVSYNDKVIREKIETEVGKPFSLKERWSMGGVGSSKLFISQTSINIHNLLVLDQNLNTCNVELRPQGIIVRFRSLLETYALIIPYYKLKIYKGKAEEYSIYRDESLIKILANTKTIHKFFNKINTLKAKSRPPSIDDL
jgi:hypothetical protein